MTGTPSLAPARLAIMPVAPYGSWSSPLAARALTAARVDRGDPTLDGGVAHWTETRSEEGGRTSVWRLDGDTPVELTPGDNVRTTVHEYGGGAWAVRDGVLVYSTFPSGAVFVLDAAGRRPLVAVAGLRFAAFEVHPERGLVVAVREDHRTSDLDCVNTLVALDLDGDNTDGGRVLAAGADFYGPPTLAADGRLAWVEWDHPNMPWDATRLMTGRLDGPAPTGVRQVAGTPDSAPCYPAWCGDDLVFCDDRSGFWNLYALDAAGAERRLTGDDHDYCGPAWQLTRDLSPLADGRVACVRYAGGVGTPGLVGGDGRFVPLLSEPVAGASLGTDGHDLAVLVQRLDRPATLERWSAATGTLSPVVAGEDAPLPAAFVSPARPLTWTGPQGEVHAFYFPPANPAFTAPEGTRPPLRVLSHGGPTGAAHAGYQLARQYWTSRGWAVLDVNYGGSALFGRAYRERLRGQWGVVDVRDCVDAAQTAVAAGLAHPGMLAIEGGSAGGYTTLAALTASDVFSAGHSLYGIADLALLARETHKFESRYLDGLLGGGPDDVPAVYAERSPLSRLDRLNCPILVQQGREDRVVPPSQAVALADAARRRGLPLALVLYDGEGHGFRRAENIVASVEAAESFFGQVFGFPTPGVPRLPIENLDAAGRA